jgi:hypothetical protein
MTQNSAPVATTLAMLRAGLIGGLFRRQVGDDFFEARIAAERVPEGMQL